MIPPLPKASVRTGPGFWCVALIAHPFYWLAGAAVLAWVLL